MPANQVKILRVLENGRFHRVGGSGERQADLRIVAATNRDLKSAVTGEDEKREESQPERKDGNPSNTDDLA